LNFMESYNSFREIIDLLEPGCQKLYVIPPYNPENRDGDYLYLLHKDIIESNNNPQIEPVGDWQYARFSWKAIKRIPTVIHCNWFEVRSFREVFKFLVLWLNLIIFHKSGGKIVWTIHNKGPQSISMKWFNLLLQNWIAKNADRIHVHCSRAIRVMSDKLDIDPSRFVVLSHPKFPAYLMPRSAAIEALNQRYGFTLQARNKIYLVFGNIGPHKRIIEILEIFKQLSPNKKLIIIGPVKHGCLGYYRRVQKTADQYQSRIFLLPKSIESIIVPEFFNAADICLFNYDEILTSGGVELARSYQKAIIAPDKGCLKDLIDNPNVSLFQDENQLKQLLVNS
jgi:beta-1,4-mannosyltransferase